jgi:predicted TIM-barrel fold metal-dependent hydrolase
LKEDRMPTDLNTHINQTRLVDTHEHLGKEHDWVEEGPDILQDLFGNYVPADLKTAGASPDALNALMDAENPDLAARFEGIRPAWEATQFTGYGEAVRLIASECYGIEELSTDSLAAAGTRLKELRQPGQRYRLLKESAGLDHIQTDDFCWPCVPDTSGPEFFLYDLSWAGFCNGKIDVPGILEETGVEVTDLTSLREGMTGLFTKYAGCAIAVKAQHAYNRTLNWAARSDEDAGRALERTLRNSDDVPLADQLCLGDWCWARGVELAIDHNLPFKIHTGYYAGNDRMPVDRIKAGNLCALLAAYPKARFVLMHIAYPYSHELIALAKHYPNVWVDLCWAWSIDPFSSADFVRRFIHTVPINKLFGFGGDTRWPTSALAYTVQMRRWFARALQDEVSEGLLTEPQAITIASRLMHDNAYDCFDIAGARANIAAAAS